LTERYHALFERHPLPMWVYDPATLAFLDVNEAAVRHYGYTRTEFLAMTIADIRPVEDLPALYASVQAGASLPYDHAGIWRHRKKDGAIIEVEVTSGMADTVPGTDTSTHPRLVVAHDVTERRRAQREREAALRENAFLLQEAADVAERQRRFLRDVLSSVTEGRLCLCETVEELPPPLPQPVGTRQRLTAPTLSVFRRTVQQAAAACGMTPERSYDFMTAVSEAAMNAVVHAGGGVGVVRTDPAKSRLQVRIEDQGKGIDLATLPRATLERGYSTGGMGFGHGFWMILKTCDTIHLRTSTQGTTVVLEQGQAPPPPAWHRQSGCGQEFSHV
jgi:PAS domain S-box-containing protein